MEAEIVWRTWRRILQEPAFAAAVFAPDRSALNRQWHLTVEEKAVADAYASAGDRSMWAVSTYRYRLVSAVLHALEMGAPLTRVLLEVAGFDLRALAAEFLNRMGWFDHGPFVYTTCSGFLADLVDRHGAHVQGLRDLAHVEAAAVELIRSAADKALLRFDRQLQGTDIDSQAFKQSGTGKVVTTDHLISQWLTDATQIGRTQLIEGSESYLVFMRADSERYGLLMVEPLAVRFFDEFRQEKTLAEAARSLRIDDAAIPELRDLLKEFVEAQVLTALNATLS